MALQPKSNIFNTTAVDDMKQIWKRTRTLYQRSVISHILQMIALNIPPDPVLIVQNTGSGESINCSIDMLCC